MLQGKEKIGAAPTPTQEWGCTPCLCHWAVETEGHRPSLTHHFITPSPSTKFSFWHRSASWMLWEEQSISGSHYYCPAQAQNRTRATWKSHLPFGVCVCTVTWPCKQRPENRLRHYSSALPTYLFVSLRIYPFRHCLFWERVFYWPKTQVGWLLRSVDPRAVTPNFSSPLKHDFCGL